MTTGNVDVYIVRVAGISHYQEAAAKLRAGDACDLIPEADNPHDANAVMVVSEHGQIGYVERDKAAIIAEALAAGVVVVATVQSVAPVGVDATLGARVQIALHYPA